MENQKGKTHGNPHGTEIMELRLYGQDYMVAINCHEVLGMRGDGI